MLVTWINKHLRTPSENGPNRSLIYADLVTSKHGHSQTLIWKVRGQQCLYRRNKNQEFETTVVDKFLSHIWCYIFSNEKLPNRWTLTITEIHVLLIWHEKRKSLGVLVKTTDTVCANCWTLMTLLVLQVLSQCICKYLATATTCIDFKKYLPSSLLSLLQAEREQVDHAHHVHTIIITIITQINIHSSYRSKIMLLHTTYKIIVHILIKLFLKPNTKNTNEQVSQFDNDSY